MSGSKSGVGGLLNSFWLLTFFVCLAGLASLVRNSKQQQRLAAAASPPGAAPAPNSGGPFPGNPNSADPVPGGGLPAPFPAGREIVNRPPATVPNLPPPPTQSDAGAGLKPLPPRSARSPVTGGVTPLPVVVPLPTGPSGNSSTPVAAGGTADRPPEGMVLVPAGTFWMGKNRALDPADGPIHEVAVGSFWMDRFETTNGEFAEFVRATDYRTTAETQGWGFVFDSKQGRFVPKRGVSWRAPEGGNSSTVGHEDEPVVQVSWLDATACAAWQGKRLPTEAEWEYAARGEWVDADYPWGYERLPGGKHPANAWQGTYATGDAGADGYRGLAPVGKYAPNSLGLSDLLGNAAEWCSDWFDADYYRRSPHDRPTGAAAGTLRVYRGGSWASLDNGAPAFAVYGRGALAPATPLPTVGFRCVKDAPGTAPTARAARPSR